MLRYALLLSLLVFTGRAIADDLPEIDKKLQRLLMRSSPIIGICKLTPSQEIEVAQYLLGGMETYTSQINLFKDEQISGSAQDLDILFHERDQIRDAMRSVMITLEKFLAGESENHAYDWALITMWISTNIGKMFDLKAARLDDSSWPNVLLVMLPNLYDCLLLPAISRTEPET